MGSVYKKAKEMREAIELWEAQLRKALQSS